jgi:hypothetical protein
MNDFLSSILGQYSVDDFEIIVDTARSPLTSHTTISPIIISNQKSDSSKTSISSSLEAAVQSITSDFSSLSTYGKATSFSKHKRYNRPCRWSSSIVLSNRRTSMQGTRIIKKDVSPIRPTRR